MQDFLKSFFKAEDGAVTVDWVVITAAVVGFSAVGITLLETNTGALMDAAGATVAAENDF